MTGRLEILQEEEDANTFRDFTSPKHPAAPEEVSLKHGTLTSFEHQQPYRSILS